MDNLLTVLNITAPVFLLATIGYVWVRLGFEYRVEFVTRLAMTLSLPCLIFTSLMKSDVAPGALATLSLASLTAYGMVTVACFLLVKALQLDVRTFLAPLIFGNTGNLGMPLALFAFGEIGLDYAVVVFAVMAMISFTFGIWLVSGGGSLKKLVQEPLVAATVLGAIFLWQGWQTPLVLTNTLELIGQIVIPIMLITLGVAVARLETKAMGQAVALSVVKAGICAGCAWWVATWFRLEPVAAAVLIVQVSTPIAVTSYMLAEKYGADAQPVAGLVVASTLLSVITLPLILAFVI
ncbi:MAG: AEC family transporter [Pseudomonadota bacterium]